VEAAEFSEEPAFSYEPVTQPARWRRRTASGVVLTCIALGLQEALEDAKNVPAIVQPAPGGPPGPEPIDLYMDPDHPEYTVAVIRPWLWR
jgi:hypothetical protein